MIITKIEKARTSLIALMFIVICMWVVEFINNSTGHSLNVFGITPRTFDGLVGIPMWIFLHGNIEHLFGNTIPLLLFGSIVAFRGFNIFIGSIIFITIISGFGLWMIAPTQSVTVGASGLVFGLFSYIITIAIVEKQPVSILIALIIGFTYGSTMILGVLPIQHGVSWQGHLTGALAGICYTFIQFKPTIKKVQTNGWRN